MMQLFKHYSSQIAKIPDQSNIHKNIVDNLQDICFKQTYLEKVGYESYLLSASIFYD